MAITRLFLIVATPNFPKVKETHKEQPQASNGELGLPVK